MIYLASPYSHSNPLIQEQRFLEVASAAAQLIHEGLPVYSPIAHWHTIARLSEKPISHEQFIHIDFQLIDVCSELIVLAIPGYEQSNGVQAEIEYARCKNKKVTVFHKYSNGWRE